MRFESAAGASSRAACNTWASSIQNFPSRMVLPPNSAWWARSSFELQSGLKSRTDSSPTIGVCDCRRIYRRIIRCILNGVKWTSTCSLYWYSPTWQHGLADSGWHPLHTSSSGRQFVVFGEVCERCRNFPPV